MSFNMQLLYVSNLDLTSIEIDVPVAPFAVNAWTKELVDVVAIADSKDDRTFGELQVCGISIFFNHMNV